MEIKKATRQGVKPLIGAYSLSGCGKTYSALLLARGIVGPTGKIVMIDSESGRGSLYSDVIEGGYDVLEIKDSFSPQEYMKAIGIVEKSGADICLIDSASHEWEGIDGVTDSAMKISQKRAAKYDKEWDGVVQFGDWKDPKMNHAKFMLKLLQSPLPIIVCLRAKQKSQQTKGTKEMVDAGIIPQSQIGKTVVVKDEFCSPIQDEAFIYEMTAHFEILHDHTIILTKASHPDLRKCFPEDKKSPITMEHGRKIAEWCRVGGQVKLTSTKPLEDPEIKALKKQVWDLFKAKKPEMVAQQNWVAINQFLYSNEIFDGALDPIEALPNISIARFKEIIPKIEAKL